MDGSTFSSVLHRNDELPSLPWFCTSKRKKELHEYRRCLCWSLVISDYKRIAPVSSLPFLACSVRAELTQAVLTWPAGTRLSHPSCCGHYWKKGLSLFQHAGSSVLTFLLLCWVTVMLYRMSAGHVLCLQSFADSWGVFSGSTSTRTFLVDLCKHFRCPVDRWHSLSNKFWISA